MNKKITRAIATTATAMVMALANAAQPDVVTLPAEVLAAANNMVTNGSGPFTVGTGRHAQINEVARFGGFKAGTQFPIASASKFLAAATVMTLVDDGVLNLDKAVHTWLPNLPEDAGKLTLRQLLSQTSGLAGSNGEMYDLAQDHRITLGQSAIDVAQRPLTTRPGEVFAYGGPGFQVAGAVVEAATGKSWALVFKEKIANPLKMNGTYWMHLRLDSEKELPVDETRNPVLQGGAVSTAEDYLNFLSMLAQGGIFNGKRVLSQSSIDAMLQDQTSHARMTPTHASVLPDAHYALGSWCETWNGQGVCDRNSSIGFFGAYPWIEKSTGRFGIILPYIRNNAFRFWPEMVVIRDVLNK